MRWTVQFDQVSRQRGYDLVRFGDIYFNVGTCTFPIDLIVSYGKFCAVDTHGFGHFKCTLIVIGGQGAGRQSAALAPTTGS